VTEDEVRKNTQRRAEAAPPWPGLGQLGYDVYGSSPFAPKDVQEQAEARARARRELIRHPSRLWEAIKEPYEEDIKAGHTERAIGRGVFDLGSTLLTAGGAAALKTGKLGKLAKTGKGADAAKSADEFVDLVSAARRNHILYGDKTGGGHLWPGLPGKTPFPKGWSADKVMHEISDVATDPNLVFRTGRGGSTIVTGTRDGVDIQVILRDGDIITGYQTNLPRNP